MRLYNFNTIADNDIICTYKCWLNTSSFLVLQEASDRQVAITKAASFDGS